MEIIKSVKSSYKIKQALDLDDCEFKCMVYKIIIYAIRKIRRNVSFAKLYIYFVIIGTISLIVTAMIIYQSFKHSEVVMNNFPTIIMTLVTTMVISLFYLSLKEIVSYHKDKEECKDKVEIYYNFRHCETDKRISKFVEEKYKSLFL